MRKTNSNASGHLPENQKSSITVRRRDRDWLEAYVPYRQDWIQIIKNIHGRIWQPDKVCWLLPYVKATFYHLRDEIKLSNVIFEFKIEAKIPEVYLIDIKESQKKENITSPFKYETLNEAQKNAIFKTVEFLTLSRYSYSTISGYRNALISLFCKFKYIPPEEIKSAHVSSYLFEKIKTQRISTSAQNQIISAYKIFAEKILKRPKEFIEIPRPRKAKKLPGVLSTNEVVCLLNAVTNLKHKLILLLIYSSGLRISEVVNILLSSLQIERGAIHIKAAKGKKDRYVVLAKSAVPYLEKYMEEYRPKRWLFEGLYGGKYSTRSVQNIFNKALERSKINAYATPHTLRHSYATHCLENGHNLKMVQQALGHKSLKTTEVYLHISANSLKQLESPLDSLKLK